MAISFSLNNNFKTTQKTNYSFHPINQFVFKRLLKTTDELLIKTQMHSCFSRTVLQVPDSP